MRNKSGDLEIITIETPSLGDRSYIAIVEHVAIAIDPQRDTDRIEEILVRRGATLHAVLETHFHNDYITGGLALARTTGAEYVVPTGPALGFDATRLEDDQQLRIGPMEIRVLDSAGHTDAHRTYEVRHVGAKVGVAFTGGSLLIGGTGRTDLLGAHRAEELARKQYHSVRRIGETLPPATLLYPTHGFGSFCSAGPVVGGGATLTEQLRGNPAFTLSEESFVTSVLSRLGAYPRYFNLMGPRNIGFPAPADLSPLRRLTLEDAAALANGGRSKLVDVRPRAESAAGHVAKSLCIDGSGALASWFGWIASIDQPIGIIAQSINEASAAQRELQRIGVDFIVGAHIADQVLVQTSKVAPIVSTPRASFADLAVRIQRDPEIVIIDVREDDERADSYIEGSIHIPAHKLPTADLSTLKGREIWTHCGAGFRSAIAASLLERRGLRSTIVDDRFFVAREAGLPIHLGSHIAANAATAR